MDMCTIHTCIVVHTCIRIKDHRYTDHLRERRSQAGPNEGPIPEYWSGRLLRSLEADVLRERGLPTVMVHVLGEEVRNGVAFI